MRNSVGRLSNGISVTVGVCQGFGFEQEPFDSPFDQAVAAAQEESIDLSRGDSASARESASLRSCATLICNQVRFRSFAKNASPEDMRNATRALAEAYGPRGLPLNPSTTGFTASSLMHGRQRLAESTEGPIV